MISGLLQSLAVLHKRRVQWKTVETTVTETELEAKSKPLEDLYLKANSKAGIITCHTTERSKHMKSDLHKYIKLSTLMHFKVSPEHAGLTHSYYYSYIAIASKLLLPKVVQPVGKTLKTSLCVFYGCVE